ncbi:MAG: metal-sensitive transcriptional regulator [Propionibacteriaceae bacterium]|nr:metal-sensitive transcriptional regulator [Propionibacteriaceae bacterium]
MQQATKEPDIKHQVLNRLKRAQGQLRAVIAAVENDDDCRAVVTQLSAVSKAIDRAGFIIVMGNMKLCLSADADQLSSVQQDQKTVRLDIAEIEKIFMMLK